MADLRALPIRGSVKWGLLLITVVSVMTLLAPWIAPHDPLQTDTSRSLEVPSRE